MTPPLTHPIRPARCPHCGKVQEFLPQPVWLLQKTFDLMSIYLRIFLPVFVLVISAKEPPEGSSREFLHKIMAYLLPNEWLVWLAQVPFVTTWGAGIAGICVLYAILIRPSRFTCIDCGKSKLVRDRYTPPSTLAVLSPESPNQMPRFHLFWSIARIVFGVVIGFMVIMILTALLIRGSRG